MLRLILPVGVLSCAGLVVLSSVAPGLFYLQLVWIGVGAGMVALFYFVDWRLILTYRWAIGGIYAATAILLLVVLFASPLVRGVRSWIVLGPINFQPVELAKVALILGYAAYFSRRHVSIARVRHILVSFFLFAVPASLVVLQPDLGSALILFGIWAGFLFMSGLPKRRAALALLAIAVAGALTWFYVLEGYQRERVAGVFYPERNVLGINYSVAQAKIAVGSAGLFGKGYGQGSQVQLGFLPEPASDFIFAALVEEWGVVGGLAVFGAFFALIAGIVKIGIESEKNFERFACLGAIIVFGLQFLFNVGSNLGLTPVIGVNFPFLSYGGSNMAASFFILSLVNAIGKKH